MINSAQLVSYTSILACSLLTAWSAWDRGGGYYSTQMKVALFLLAAGLFAGLLLSVRVVKGLNDANLCWWHLLRPPSLAVLSMVIWGGAILQTLPLSTHAAAFFAPGSSQTYGEWTPVTLVRESLAVGKPSMAELAESASQTKVSVALTYTRLALVGPVAFASMCWICFLSFRYVHTIFVFLFVIAGSGAVFSFFGLVDTVRLVRDWQVELRQMLTISPVGADDPFGPFVNNNNASGFLCLAIGCAVGLLVLGEHLLSAQKKTSGDTRSGFSSGLIIARLGSVALIVTLVAGVIGSNSRGGFLGLLTGSLVVLAFLLPRFSKLKFAFAFAGVAWLSWLVISGLGFGNRSKDRFETLLDHRIMEDPRLDHWSDALVAAVHYLPFGSGLGTYRYACLPFQENGAPLWFVNADGMPIEWLVEGGVWLLPMVVLGLIVLVRHALRINVVLKRIENSGVELAGSAADSVAYAKSIWAVALFSLPALLVTQCFDFGITLMPLLLTFAGISGAVLQISATVTGLEIDSAAASVGKSDSQSRSIVGSGLFTSIRKTRVRSLRRLASGPVLLVLVILALGISAKELYVASIAQDEMNWLRREGKQRLLVDMPHLSDRLRRLESLALANPRNAMVWNTLGQMRIAEQQRLGAERLFQLQQITVDSHANWLATKTLRHASYSNAENGSFSACLLPTQNADEYREARRDFIKALLLNPLDPTVRVSLLELDMVASDANVASRELLLQAARLRPRSESFLRYLLWFAADHPGTERLPEISVMREALRQERLRVEH